MAHDDKKKDPEQIVEALLQEYEALKFPFTETGRRRNDRIRETIPVEFKGARKEGRGETKDIGAQGISVVCQEVLASGEDYVFSLHLPQLKEPIEVKGKVTWVSPDTETGGCQAGVEFSEITEEDRRKILAHLELLREEEGKRPVERRKFLRVPKLLQVTVEREKGEPIRGIVADIGMGGLRVLINKQLANGCQVKLTIEMEEGNPIAVEGRIIWSNQVEAMRQYAHGIEFVHAVLFLKASQEIGKVIQDYLEFQKTQPQTTVLDSLLKLPPKKDK